MSKQVRFVHHGIPKMFRLPLRMYAPTSFYGLPYQLSADRTSLVYRSRPGYDFEPEIAQIEGAIYSDETKIEGSGPDARTSVNA